MKCAQQTAAITRGAAAQIFLVLKTAIDALEGAL